ncbi:MAG: hypothetical protein ACOX30_00190 [Dethiobacteria bacterium]
MSRGDGSLYSRLEGITPADVSMLLLYLERPGLLNQTPPPRPSPLEGEGE